MSGADVYIGAKAQSQARESSERALEERKKGLIVLILDHLLTFGYLETVDKLQAEANVSMSEFEAADNVDLLTILQDYENYFELRFRKKPKLFRRGDGGGSSSSGARKAITRERMSSARYHAPVSSLSGASGGSSSGSSSSSASASVSGAALPGTYGGGGGGGGARPPPAAPPGGERAGSAAAKKPSSRQSGRPPPAEKTDEGGMDDGYLGLSVNPISSSGKRGKVPPIDAGGAGASSSRGGASSGDGGDGHNPDEYFDYRMLKPLPLEHFNSEQRELANTIQRDIFTKNPNVRWDDVLGLDDAKKVLREAVVMPVRYPQLFTGILTPWKGLLLFGPPGTGKTMLAKAVATECKTTFFNISASTIVSKWRGDSEKLVRMLFELARHHAPSTIFLDELDAIMGQRGGDGPGMEHEGSRRMKTELLIQMDGLNKSDDLVFVLCASNLPWELDTAMLRRLEKRILVPLPTAEARAHMFSRHLPPSRAPGMDYNSLASMTEGYSGSDIYLVAKEAAMRPLRRLMDEIEASEVDLPMEQLKLGGVTTDDVSRALSATRPSTDAAGDKYGKWMVEFGSTL